MKKISKIAIKTDGKINTAPIGRYHVDIIAKHPTAKNGQRGFIETPPNKFISRSVATKVALKSGQTKTTKPLHSHQVKKVK